MARQAYVDHRTKLILFWSPKIGCTSLINWFVYGALAKPKGFIQETTPYHDARGWLAGEGYAVNSKIALNMIKNADYETMVITRHPATRILSAYLNKFVLYPKKPITGYEKLEPFAAAAYRKWKNNIPVVQAKNTYEGLSFREFLTHIKSTKDACRSGEPDLDHHWSTQVPQAFIDKDFQYQNIFYLEEYQKAIDWLNAKYGINHKMVRTNRTKYSEIKDANVADMSSIDLALKPELHSKENFLQPDILEIIADIYAVDFDIFGYDKTDIAYTPNAKITA